MCRVQQKKKKKVISFKFENLNDHMNPCSFQLLHECFVYWDPWFAQFPRSNHSVSYFYFSQVSEELLKRLCSHIIRNCLKSNTNFQIPPRYFIHVMSMLLFFLIVTDKFTAATVPLDGTAINAIYCEKLNWHKDGIFHSPKSCVTRKSCSFDPQTVLI